MLLPYLRFRHAANRTLGIVSSTMLRMSLWRSTKSFWRAFRASKGSSRPRHAGDSLARTLRDSTHVRGGGTMMGLGLAGTEQQHQIVAEGHEDYTKSFEDEN